MINKKVLFENIIDLLLSVKWSQKITAKHYDRLYKYSIWLKWGRVAAAILTSGAAASLFAWNTFLGKVFSLIGALITLIIETLTNKFNLNKNTLTLFDSKEEFWDIAVELTTIARKVMVTNDSKYLVSLNEEYKKILDRVEIIQKQLPSASKRDINKASNDIKNEHSDDNWENERHLLPPDILRYRKEH